MKKKLLLMLLAVTIFMTGCSSGVSQEEHDALKTEVETLQNENADLQSENTGLQSAKGSLQDELDAMTTEYNDYKEKMQPYEKLSIAEAEAKTAEAEQQKAEAEQKLKEEQEAEQAAKEATEREAAEQQAAKEAAGYETGITYDQLSRTPDEYNGEKVKFSGKVIQVLQGDTEIQIRLAVDNNYDAILYCGYDPSIVSSRILEDDQITIYGTSLGLFSYNSALTKITIPAVYVDKIDQ